MDCWTCSICDPPPPFLLPSPLTMEAAAAIVRARVSMALDGTQARAVGISGGWVVLGVIAQ
eukprot:766080-Hanusia_phi.AAC.1